MAKYIKLPASVDAIQYIPTKVGLADVLRFLNTYTKAPLVGIYSDYLTINSDYLTIKGLDGVIITAFSMDWIIREADGAYITCKPSVFEARYQKVKE